MKHFTVQLSIIMAVLFAFTGFVPSNASGEYCVSEGGFAGYVWISGVELNGGANNNQDPEKATYSNYTGTTLSTLTKGQAGYTLKVTGYAGGENDVHVNAWIDFDQSNSFNNISGEEFSLGKIAGSNSYQNFSTTLSFPSLTSLPSGKTRMRVTARQADEPGPCDNSFSGEVEDYTIGIAEDLNRELIINKNGTGTGTVTSGEVDPDPKKIDCGTTCSAIYDEGESVTLTATPSGDSLFTGWSGGGCSGSSTSCSTTVYNAEQAVTATFDLPVVETPVMVEFNNRLYQAVRRSDNGIYTRYTTDGDTWTDWIKNGFSPRKITMTVFDPGTGARLYLGAIGGDGQTIYTRYTSNGDDWSSWVANGKTLGLITMTAFNPGDGDRLYQAVTGMIGQKIFTRYTTDGSNWSSWVANGATPGVITMTVFNPGDGDRLYQAVRGMDGQTIYTRSTSDGINWSSWVANGKTLDKITMTVFNPGDGDRLYQAVTSLVGQKIFTRYTTDGSTWSTWVSNGLTPGTITMTVFNPGGGARLYQAVRGMNGETNYTRYTEDGAHWNSWASGGSTVDDIAMTTFSTGNRLYQAVQNLNNNVATRYTSDGDNWQGWSLENSLLMGVEMSVAMFQDGQEIVFLRKLGDGNGTLLAGEFTCDLTCRELALPYVQGEMLRVDVSPSIDSNFIGWQTEKGETLSSIYYTQPGEIVYAVFEKK